MKVVFKNRASSQDHIVDLDAAGVTALYGSDFVSVRVYSGPESWTDKTCRITGRVLHTAQGSPFIEVSVAD